ncbi:hypothetical protein KCU91_g5400, partial [Aureobasidium melanogenum]
MLPNIGDTTAAIVWGIPVKLVDILNNLDAYRKAIPTIHTLRLCNQFGKGDSAFITRLPKELIRLSDTHPEWPLDEWLCNGYSNLPADVQKLVDAGVADDFDEYGEECVWELRDENSLNWPSKVRNHMSSRGNNDVLRKHFGVDIWIMHERLDTPTTDYLKRTKRFSHRTGNPEKATICYLILPTRAAQWRTRIDSDWAFSGELSGSSANSVLVDCSSLSLTEEHQPRFARVMLRLALKPSVHPSQLRGALSAASAMSTSTSPLRQVPFPTTNGNPSVEEKTKRDAATKKRTKDLEASRWPKLMLLVDQSYSDA